MSDTDKYHDFKVEDWHYISSFLEYSDIIEIDYMMKHGYIPPLMKNSHKLDKSISCKEELNVRMSQDSHNICL